MTFNHLLNIYKIHTNDCPKHLGIIGCSQYNSHNNLVFVIVLKHTPESYEVASAILILQTKKLDPDSLSNFPQSHS